MTAENKTPTGIVSLDHLLKGGLIRNASIMVEGTPGTGKSTLGMQFIAEGIARGESGIIVTLEEYPSEFYRDALNYGWDFHEWEREGKVRVVATSPDALKHQLETGGPLMDEIQSIDAKRIMVDSVNQFERISTEAAFLRTTLSGLIHAFKLEDMFSFFTKDIEASNVLEYWGRYSVDVLIELSFTLMKDRERHRFIEIHKARGQSHILGRHAFRIDETGIKIFPRPVAQMLEAKDAEPLTPERVSSGVAGLDEMLGGGFIRGQSILLAGGTGTGKSLTAASFAEAGVKANEGTLYVSMEDPPGRILQNAVSVGIDLLPSIQSGQIEMIYLPPVELSPDELLFEIESKLDTGKYQRMVIDSVSSLRSVTPEPEYLRDIIYALSNMCFMRNISGLFTAEIEQMTGPFKFTDFGGSFAVDTLILLRLVEVTGQLRKSISIIKVRGSNHDRSLREYIFTPKGLKIGDPFEHLAGLLTGTPTAQRPVGIEPYFGEVSSEEQKVVSALSARKEATVEEIADAVGMTEEQAREILEDLAETGFVTKTEVGHETRYRSSLMTAR